MNLDHHRIDRPIRKGKPLLNVLQRPQNLHCIRHRHQDRVRCSGALLRFAVHHLELNKNSLQLLVNAYFRFTDIYVNMRVHRGFSVGFSISRTALEPPVRDRRAAWLWFIRSTRSGIESSSINLDRRGRNRTTHIAISVTYAFPRKCAAESFQRVKNAISDRSTRLCGGSPLELPFLSGHLPAGHEPLGPVGVGWTAALRIHMADTAM